MSGATSLSLFVSTSLFSHYAFPAICSVPILQSPSVLDTHLYHLQSLCWLYGPWSRPPPTSTSKVHLPQAAASFLVRLCSLRPHFDHASCCPRICILVRRLRLHWALRWPRVCLRTRCYLLHRTALASLLAVPLNSCLFIILVLLAFSLRSSFSLSSLLARSFFFIPPSLVHTLYHSHCPSPRYHHHALLRLHSSTHSCPSL